MKRVVFALFGLVAGGCGQEIIVIECDGHTPDNPGQDGGTRLDATELRDAAPADRDAPDGGGLDAQGLDVRPTDGGPVGCGAAPYCIEQLTSSAMETVVRSPVTFTPTVNNPGGVPLSFRVDPVLGHRRPANRPALVPSDITFTLNANPTTGEVSFVVSEVPTWFMTTTFTVRLYAKGPAGNDPEVSATAEVRVKGNVVIAETDVFAIASDGRPARSQNFSQGRLISGSTFASGPEDLLMARDGTLIVFSSVSTPPRLRRFELTGENVLLGDFALNDGSGNPLIPASETGRGITQLPTGEVALLVYDSASTPDSKIVLWAEDGSYLRTLPALEPNEEWVGLSYTDAGELVTLVRETGQGLERIDPNTGAKLGAIVEPITSGWNLIRHEGAFYVGQSGAVIRVTPQGAIQMVANLGGGTSDWWQYLTPFGTGAVLAARDTRASEDNVALIRGTQGQGWFRPAGVGGAYIQALGMAYLE